MTLTLLPNWMELLWDDRRVALSVEMKVVRWAYWWVVLWVGRWVGWLVGKLVVRRAGMRVVVSVCVLDTPMAETMERKSVVL